MNQLLFDRPPTEADFAKLFAAYIAADIRFYRGWQRRGKYGGWQPIPPEEPMRRLIEMMDQLEPHAPWIRRWKSYAKIQRILKLAAAFLQP